MKAIALFFIAALVAAVDGCAFGQVSPCAYKWVATVKVIDQKGNPVSGADAMVCYSVPDFKNQDNEIACWIKGTTDQDGVFTASHTDCSWDLGVRITKAGYYPSSSGFQFGNRENPDAVRNPTIIVALKAVNNPTAMYAKSLDSGPPILNQTVGYDLAIGDWVAPYGKGVNTDIVFAKEYEETSPSDYYSIITVSFPKNGDGIQEFTVLASEKGSGLRSPHQAPAEGYQPKWVQEIATHPGKPSKNDYDENRNYFFRVRTILDETGRVKSALYGKIYGDFMRFRYYLNPVPNSRNIEFDPKQNLFKRSRSFNQILPP